MKHRNVNFSEIISHPNTSLSAKDYVEKDVPKEVRSIADDMKGLADVMRAGGGVGFDLSALRPNPEPVEGIDLHKLKAMELFNCSYEEVTPEQRKEGKLHNFGEVYGTKTLVGMDIGKENGDHSVIVLGKSSKGTITIDDYIAIIGEVELFPFQKELLQQLQSACYLGRAGKTNHTMQLWNQLKQSLKEQELVFPNMDVEKLEKHVKKLRTRVRKEKNPGMLKQLKNELQVAERELKDAKQSKRY